MVCRFKLLEQSEALDEVIVGFLRLQVSPIDVVLYRLAQQFGVIEAEAQSDE